MANDVQTPSGGYGQPCDLLRENLRLNSGSFSTTAGTDADLFLENALVTAMPLRTAHNIDTTAYTVGAETASSWQHQVRGRKTINGNVK